MAEVVPIGSNVELSMPLQQVVTGVMFNKITLNAQDVSYLRRLLETSHDHALTFMMQLENRFPDNRLKLNLGSENEG